MEVEDYSWTEQDQQKYDNDMKALTLAVSNIIDLYVVLEHVDVQFYTWNNCVIKCSRETEYKILKNGIRLIIQKLDNTDVQLTDFKTSLSRINLTISVEVDSYKNNNKTVRETHIIAINN